MGITNEITIDIEAIQNAPNFSITDGETIRQIALYHMKNPCDNAILDKINPMFQFAALYPEVMISFDNLPDKLKITDSHKEVLKNIHEKRKNRK